MQESSTHEVKQKKIIKVAAIDFIPDWGDLNGNINRLIDAVNIIATEEIDYAVFPETATTGYIFDDYSDIKPYLDTIPGKTTSALLPILKEYNMYMSIGIAEKDMETGIAYNTAVLMGPEGIVGTYRKRGLNSQDQKLFAPGNTFGNVFSTEIGKIGLLICYDDTYWQYARLAALEGADIIGWHSVSDRKMPSENSSEDATDHSTIAHVQHLSAFNGVWVICATRSGIETNPMTKAQLYYNGGSSIWSPLGNKITQAPVVPPIEIKPGLNAIYSAVIDVIEAKHYREKTLQKRRPELYHPTLALHKAPDDVNATKDIKNIVLTAIQWDMNESSLDKISLQKDELVVLPELSTIKESDLTDNILDVAEEQGGDFENKLCEIAKKGAGYIVGSYPEVDGEYFYHTVVLAGPKGTILGRYRATHLNDRDARWASKGNKLEVVETPIGRIGLALNYELTIVEVGGVFAVKRADIIAAPAGEPHDLRVEIDARLYSVENPPTGLAEFHPYATATLQQLWVVCGGREKGTFTSSGIYGPEPVMLTPTLLAKEGAESITHKTTVPAPSTWISQERLIHGQMAIFFPPLVK